MDIKIRNSYHIYRGLIALSCISLLVLGVYAVRDIHRQLVEIQHLTTQEPVDPPVEVKVTQTPHPHQEHIEKHEKDADMPLLHLARIITKEEGWETKPYLDTRNVVTIGVGRSLATNGITSTELYAIVPDVDHKYLLKNTEVRNGRIMIKSLSVAKQIFKTPLTQHDVELLLTDDLKNVNIEAESVFGLAWQAMDVPRKEAILDILFNTGLPHFMSFVDFIASVKAQNWNKAASDLLMSKAARTHIARYHRAASVIQTGDAKYFNLGD